MTISVLFAVAVSQRVHDLLCYEQRRLLCLLGCLGGHRLSSVIEDPDEKSPLLVIAY